MSSVYVTYPGFENHDLVMQGKKNIKSIKVGIFSGRGDGQDYVNGRYGQSQLHMCLHTRVNFTRMKDIERRVLLELQQRHGFVRQHGKKEHFIIPNSKVHRRMFVACVKALYEDYCN